MPCRYDPTPEEEAMWRKQREEREKLEKEQQKQNKKKLDELTRLLCDTMRCWEISKTVPDSAKQWWEQHKKADATRRRREAKAEAVKRQKEEELVAHTALLKKLSKKERELLNKHGTKIKRGK